MHRGVTDKSHSFLPVAYSNQKNKGGSNFTFSRPVSDPGQTLRQLVVLSDPSPFFQNCGQLPPASFSPPINFDRDSQERSISSPRCVPVLSPKQPKFSVFLGIVPSVPLTRIEFKPLSREEALEEFNNIPEIKHLFGGSSPRCFGIAPVSNQPTQAIPIHAQPLFWCDGRCSKVDWFASFPLGS